MASDVTIESGTARAFTIPTDAPEADGTIAWNTTTLVVVEVGAGGMTGIGYTYGHGCVAAVAQELVEKHCLGHDPMGTNALFAAMRMSQRNYGAEGIGATALSAVDIAALQGGVGTLRRRTFHTSKHGLTGPSSNLKNRCHRGKLQAFRRR